jgi:hypothetical protein
MPARFIVVQQMPADPAGTTGTREESELAGARGTVVAEQIEPDKAAFSLGALRLGLPASLGQPESKRYPERCTLWPTCPASEAPSNLIPGPVRAIALSPVSPGGRFNPETRPS